MSSARPTSTSFHQPCISSKKATEDFHLTSSPDLHYLLLVAQTNNRYILERLSSLLNLQKLSNNYLHVHVFPKPLTTLSEHNKFVEAERVCQSRTFVAQ